MDEQQPEAQIFMLYEHAIIIYVYWRTEFVLVFIIL